MFGRVIGIHGYFVAVAQDTGDSSVHHTILSIRDMKKVTIQVAMMTLFPVH